MMKVFTRILSIVITLGILAGIVPAFATDNGQLMPFRATWVCTVFQMDYPSRSTGDAAALQEMADGILDNAKAMGLNAVFLQVRPSSDAFYKSNIYPWSKYITGKQGVAPNDGFDPLDYWVSAAHARGIQLHAWINPYRVAVSDADYNALTADHPAKKNPKWVVKHTDGKYYFNPGIPEARMLVEEGVREILQRYPVDGIHLDDYFYPDESFNDAETFKQYGSKFNNVGDWRRNNIDTLISNLNTMVHGFGKTFGVSPAGVWANKSASMPDGSDTCGNQTYFANAADTRKWVKAGWLDYICPQIYWNIGYKAADYQILANWWADVVRGTNVKLYVGMADYKTGASSTSDPWYGVQEIERQLKLNRTIPEVTGEVHFRYENLANSMELQSLCKKAYVENNLDAQPEKPDEVLPEGPVHKPYMEGSNGKFDTEGNLTRAQAAMLFARVITELGKGNFLPNTNYTTTFTDVPKGMWYTNAIGFVQQHQMIAGYPDGSFQPNKTITRAEFATMVSRFGEIQESNIQFPDVSDKHWAIKYIANVAGKGYIAGYPDGTFRPEKTITRAETVKIVNSILGRVPDKSFINLNSRVNVFRDLQKNHWAYYEIIEASYMHQYTMQGNDEIWNTASGDSQYVGENGFVYMSDTFKFEVPKLRTTAPLDPLDLNKVDAIALHHMDHKDADFRQVERWHVDDNGWRAIGYNFWIGFDGTVYVGRGFNVGAGVGSHNDHIISIGFQGDYQNDRKSMPDAQYKAGVALMKWLEGKVPTITMAGGHGSWNSTDCPGQYFPLEQMVADSGLAFVPLKK